MNRDTEGNDSARERGEETPEQLTPRDAEKGRKQLLSSSADEAESSSDSATLSARMGRYANAKRSLASDLNDQAGVNVPLSSSPYGFSAFFPTAAQASPPKFVSVDELMHAVQTIQNMQLAHEIATDTSFRLEKHLTASPLRQSTSNASASATTESLESRIEKTVKRAFWDALLCKLESDPPDYSHAIVLLAETKQELLGLLLPHSAGLRNEIEQVFDMELLQQQIEHGALDMGKYANYIIGLMARMCAPARDEQVAEIKALATREDSVSQARKCVELFKAIFETLEAMKLDMANFTIAQMRPVIQQHSVEYEQTQFAKLLEEQRKHGVDGLEFTRKWLAAVYTALCNATSLEPSSSTAVTVNEAFVSLLDDNQLFATGLTPTQSQEAPLAPETLLLDAARIDVLRDRVEVCVVISAVLLTVGVNVPQVSSDQNLKASLKRQLLVLLGHEEPDGTPTPLPTQADQRRTLMQTLLDRVAMATQEHCDREQKPLSEQQTKTLASQLDELLVQHSTSRPNAVRALLKRRLLDFFRCVIAAKFKTPVPPNAASWLLGNQPQGNAASNSNAAQSLRFPAQIRIPAGLGVVEGELAAVCSQLLRLIDYNLRVFGSYYSEIVSSLMQRNA